MKRCLLAFLCIQTSFSIPFPFSSSLITNVLNNKWFMPAVVVTSLIASNALTYWHKNKQVIAAQHDVKDIQAQLKRVEEVGDEWLEKIKKIGVDVEISQRDSTVTFSNLANKKLEDLNKYMEEEGFEHQEGRYVNVRAITLQKQLEELSQGCMRQIQELERQKKEAVTIEAAKTELALDEVKNLNERIKILRTFFKLVKTNIVIPNEYNQEELIKVFNIVDLPLLSSNNNNDKCIYFYNDPESHKRKLIISLESQQPPPPKGVFSPPLQRRAPDPQDKG